MRNISSSSTSFTEITGYRINKKRNIDCQCKYSLVFNVVKKNVKNLTPPRYVMSHIYVCFGKTSDCCDFNPLTQEILKLLPSPSIENLYTDLNKNNILIEGNAKEIPTKNIAFSELLSKAKSILGGEEEIIKNGITYNELYLYLSNN